jgi:hypothetical protein
MRDLYTFFNHWLQDDTNPNWIPRLDLNPDGHINIFDFAWFCHTWQAGVY